MNQNWIEKAKDAGQRFEMPASEELWTRIQEDHRLQVKRRNLRIVWAKRASVAVAACIAVVVCLSLPWSQKDAVAVEELYSTDACVMYVNGQKNDDDDDVLDRMRVELEAVGKMSDLEK